ncbi:MAG: hypothetical protein SPJ71_02995, partial [Candidatus Limisoma sp.]|nr:hypothetical protein [Bacteroidales bacterium]MDY5893529.1 hypothetical protein [Candidatus Limisoma sp.]
MQSLRDSHHSRIYDTAAVQTCILAITQLASTRLPGRTKARPYDRMVFSVMYHVENKQSRVVACCDLPGDGFSFCKVSDLARTMSKIYAI